ncbi:Rhodanese-like protein [Hesseltinella vesiculosa]|uniref:Sulfurtransferase n=1 Tax=Hesseltinella vesiculosa TaxID=101127 RepID=A0A1X2GW14_9FUNG|nr:Rhodanese-like protein [Hesseltinella vesiculosa]
MLKAFASPSLRPFTSATSVRSMSSLISSDQLASFLDKAKVLDSSTSSVNRVKVLDSSWHMPNANRDPYQEFLAKRIPGAQFFGIDTIKDTTVDLPHMLPTPTVFAQAVGDLGITNDDHVVVYDSVGTFSAARVYWTFKAFGHQGPLSILNGGLPAWENAGHPLASGPAEAVSAQYAESPLQTDLVRDYATMLQHATAIQQGVANQPQIIDARALGRFTGEAPEPRPGLSSGHMPGAICVPFQEVATPDGQYKSDDELKQLFESKGVDLDKPIITSCGSGITASVLYVALERAGAKQVAVYDGSWTEYADKKDSIIIKDVK